MRRPQELDARTPVMTPLDAAQYRLSLLVYQADQTHREGGKLGLSTLWALAKACAEVARLLRRPWRLEDLQAAKPVATSFAGYSQGVSERRAPNTNRHQTTPEPTPDHLISGEPS